MKNRPDVTLHPITIDLEQAKATLQFLYQLVERLETDYYLTLKQHQHQRRPAAVPVGTRADVSATDATGSHNRPPGRATAGA